MLSLNLYYEDVTRKNKAWEDVVYFCGISGDCMELRNVQ